MLYSRSVGSDTYRSDDFPGYLGAYKRARKNGGARLRAYFALRSQDRSALLGNSALDVSYTVSTMHSLALGMH